MAMLDTDDRKRPLDAAELASAAKRPHLDRASSSYRSNGSPFDVKPSQGDAELRQNDEDDIPAYKGLEAYRKEAIFRKMREAQRDLVRSETKLRQLQTAVDETDERCAALNQFWDTLVEDVQTLIRDGMIPNEQHTALTNAIALSARQPSSSIFTRSLQERNASMKAILGLIVSLTPGSSPDVDELQAKCHQLAEESATLRARFHRTTEDRDALLDELNTTIERLRLLERLNDRHHSGTVKATERPHAEKEEEAERAKVEAAEAEKQAALQRKERAENEMQAGGPTANGVAGHAVSAELTQELEDAQKLAEGRLTEMEEWRQQVATLRRENEDLRVAAQTITQERLVGSDLYRELHRLYELAGGEHARLSSLNERLETENTELRETRQEVEAQARAEANASVEELRATVKAHEGDVARLRSQRDELTAEVTERKHRETVKYGQIDELKALHQVKDKRISTLQSEIRRLQLTLAVRSGDETMANRVRQGLDDGSEQAQLDADVETIADLQGRLTLAEQRADGLQRQVDVDAATSDQTELTTKVATLQGELDRITGMVREALGDEEEVAALSSEALRTLLKTRHEQWLQSKRELDTANASTTALCDELDKLGAAYSDAQSVASKRIVELGRTEEKLARLTTEKAKADNKYFSAMRAKDALENEKRVLSRTAERQTVALEKYAEADKVWKEQMQRYEAEVTALRRFVKEANGKVFEAQSVANGLREQLDKSEANIREASQLAQRRTDEYLQEAAQRQAAQERGDKAQRDLERTRKQLASAGGARKKGNAGSSFADDDQVEALNSILRCSACKDRYRNRIITRCLHTFCNECVDARIQTRQRKCPSCGLGFSTSDVQNLFFQ